MARITTIINQKGGVGKTTTAAALADGLTRRGFKALAIDADAQGSLSFIMGAEATRGIYEALKGSPAADLIQHTAQGDLLPSTPALIGADLEFTQTGREYLLRDALEGISGLYDHIVIDCPPQLGILTVNALTASTDLVIPMKADILSLQGLGQLYDTVSKVKRYCNRPLQIAGLLITQNRKTALARDLADVIADQARQLGTRLYSTQIREAVAIREAQTMQESIYTRPKANPATDYSAFVDEYLRQEEPTA